MRKGKESKVTGKW